MMIMTSVFIHSFVLLLAIASSKHACAINHRQRIPVNMDIVKDVPEEIRGIISDKVRGGFYYFIKKSIATAFRMGDITCEGHMIYPGDASDFERFIFVADLPNKQKYLRVVCKMRNRGGTERKVTEFLSKPESCEFYQITRKPIEINLLTQGNTDLVEVEDYPMAMTKRFSIREEAGYTHTIGTVRLGIHILNRKVQGLTSRIVIWKGGLEKPIITVLSRYANGTKVEINYVLCQDKFVLDSRRIGEYFLKPWDEKEADENRYSEESRRDLHASASTSTGTISVMHNDYVKRGVAGTIEGAQPLERAITQGMEPMVEIIPQSFASTVAGLEPAELFRRHYEWRAGEPRHRHTFPEQGFYHDFVEEAYRSQGLSFTEPNFYDGQLADQREQ